MKISWKILMLIVWLSGTAYGQQGDDSEAFLIGLGETIGSIHNHFDYFVNWGSIPCGAEWRPEVNKFPLDLGTAANRTRSLLKTAKHLTNDLALQQILIRRFSLSKSLLESHGKKSEEFESQWIIAFTFWKSLRHGGNDTNHALYGVLLLDGTYATERSGSLVDDANLRIAMDSYEIRSTNLPTPKIGEASSARGRLAEDEAGPYEKLQQPRFQIPKVKWNPFAGGFPMDFHAELLSARDHLAQEYACDTISLVLSEISIEHYIPIAAIQAQSLDPFTNMETNWLVVFRYRQAADSGINFYNVYVLLDGTVLHTTKEKTVGNQ